MNLRGRRAAAALLLTAPLLTVLLTGSAGATGPSPSPSPDDESPLRVSVTSLSPRAPQPGGLLEVAGTLTNVGSSPVRRIRVRLRLGDHIITRAGLHTADSERPPTVRRFGTDTEPAASELAPGATTAFDLRTTVDQLGLGDLGVYPLDVEALGSSQDAFGRVGLAPTWLPWFGGSPVRRSRVAVVLPLVDVPRRTPDDVQVDDSLAASLLPAGRLGRLLTAGRSAATGQCDRPALPATVTLPAGPDRVAALKAAVAAVTKQRAGQRCEPSPVTWAVDPDLLDTASSMTRPYEVRGTGGKLVSGRGREAATAWLASLRSTSGSGVLALPFADPDVSALTRGVAGRADLATAMTLGRSITQDVLAIPPLSTVAFPPTGPVTPAALDALTSDGTRSLVLSPSAFPTFEVVGGRSPGARTALPPSVSGSPVDALVVDDGLSRLLAGQGGVSGGQDPAQGPRLVEQRFVVETAIIAAERPSEAPRTFVLSPDRRAGVALGATTAALHDLGRLPWLCPVALTDVASRTERCTGDATGAPSTEDRPAPRTDAAGQLAPSYLRGVGRDRDAGGQLVDAVLVPDDKTSAIRSKLRRAVARAESSALRADAPGTRRSGAALHSYVGDLLAKVSVRGGRLLLTSTKGTLNVTLQNTLGSAVQCRVRFFSPTAKLSTAQTTLITVGPGRAKPASVRASARTSGQFIVLAQMVDRDGRAFGQPAEVVVRSTRYGTLALGVTGLAAAVLLVAAGIRITRRATGRSPRHPG